MRFVQLIVIHVTLQHSTSNFIPLNLGKIHHHQACRCNYVLVK